jgi:hypothetical protein
MATQAESALAFGLRSVSARMRAPPRNRAYAPTHGRRRALPANLVASLVDELRQRLRPPRRDGHFVRQSDSPWSMPAAAAGSRSVPMQDRSVLAGNRRSSKLEGTVAIAHKHSHTGRRQHACSFIEAAVGSPNTAGAMASATGHERPRSCRRPGVPARKRTQVSSCERRGSRNSQIRVSQRCSQDLGCVDGCGWPLLVGPRLGRDD